MASIWDFLDSLPKRSDVTPEELARRRQGYADLGQGGLLAGNRDQMPLSVQGAQATQDFMPVIGDALALGEAGQALSRGELAAAGLLGAGAAIGLVPGAGDALAKPVMAAGRRAADIARRVEVDPNALGSMGGNIRLRPESLTLAQEAPMEIDVWHGTPHEFPPAIRVLDRETGKTYVQAADDPIATGMIAQQPNRYEIVQENPLGMFDFSKMGTGEGAQAYGWGGYQAQRRGIAQSYRDQLTDNDYGDRRIYSLDGQDLPELTFIQKQVAGGLPPEDIVANRKKRIGLLEARIKDAPALSKGDDLTPSDFSRMSDEIDLKKMREEMAEAQSLVGKRIESRDPGALYQSKIMANPDEFMSWERPISEQAPNVREAFGLEGKVRDLIDRRKGLLDAYTSAANPAPAGDFDSLFYENPTQKKLISELEKVDSEIKNTPFGLLARDFSSAEIDRIGRLTGQDAYEALTGAAGALDWPVGADSNQRRMFQSQGKENASKMLNEFGIPGSTHIDAASRSAPYQVNLSRSGVPYETDPIVAQSVEEANQLAEMYRQKGFSADVADVATRNFVVFDENLINIVKKYGIAGAAAMLGVSALDVEQAMAQGYQPQQPQGLLSQGAR